MSSIRLRGKKGNAIIIIAIVLILLIYVTSVNKVKINDNQISTATSKSCNLIKKFYDPINKICTNGNKTIEGQESNI